MKLLNTDCEIANSFEIQPNLKAYIEKMMTGETIQFIGTSENLEKVKRGYEVECDDLFEIKKIELDSYAPEAFIFGVVGTEYNFCQLFYNGMDKLTQAIEEYLFNHNINFLYEYE